MRFCFMSAQNCLEQNCMRVVALLYFSHTCSRCLRVGVLQNYARKFRIPIDKLGFEYEMTRLADDQQQQQEKPDVGAYIFVSDDDDFYNCYNTKSSARIFMMP